MHLNRSTAKERQETQMKATKDLLLLFVPFAHFVVKRTTGHPEAEVR
jgi:hypothetical protein